MTIKTPGFSGSEFNRKRWQRDWIFDRIARQGYLAMVHPGDKTNRAQD
jgi:hypothetical protein